MDTNLIISLENDGLNLCVSDGYLYVRHGRMLSKYKYPAMEKTAGVQVFSRDGKARRIVAMGKWIFLSDFCDLYQLRAETLETVNTWKLGMDAASDIVTLCCDSDRAYVSMRGGKIAVVSPGSSRVGEFKFSEESFWDITETKKYVYVGAVDGELIRISKQNMAISKRKAVHRKNIYSVLVDDGLIYTASQDGSLQICEADGFQPLRAAKKALTNMSVILGIFREHLLTSNPARNEVSVWRKANLNLQKRIAFPTGGLSRGGIILHGSAVIGSDPKGIYVMEMGAFGA